MKNRAKRILFIGLFLTTILSAATITVAFDQKIPQATFAANEIEAALKSKGDKVVLVDLTEKSLKSRIVLMVRFHPLLKKASVTAAADLKPEGFSIRRAGKSTLIVGADPAGVMYGGLEAAELIRIGGLSEIQETDQNPYMAMRGTKFNCPLDVRTPSYTDVCDAAQHNIPEMWSWDFWTEYIDHLARYRYNYISLWSLHPFPSLVRVPGYESVALDDVRRSTVDWQEHYPLEGTGFDTPEILNNVEVVKKISIEEKMDFWRRVMRYGKARNVDFYVVTWNIFVNGTCGKYGITDDITNETTIDYFRKSVKQMFVTYPDLRGIGLTTGENMPGASFQQKEDWAFATYAQGVLDAAGEYPGRKITLIHRQHQTGALDIADKFKPVIDHPDIEFIFSFKYAEAHVYSATTQPFHHRFVNDIQSRGGLKTIWTLRNDDIYYFRWGAPDFVREFIQNMPYEVSRGYYYGSDQYIWGREFLSKTPETPRQIEIDKHWYQWMLWGRLAYDPNIDNARFSGIIEARFSKTDGKALFTAWQAASMVYPMVTGFHWGALDFQWYIESSQSLPGPAATPTGFHDVNRFISLPPHASSGYASIPDYVQSVMDGSTLAGKSPIAVADTIHARCDQSLKILHGLDSGGDKALRLTLQDIRSIVLMGKYYAHKIRAATELALFRATGDLAHQTAAIENMKASAKFWRAFASLALAQYENPLWTNRVGHVDWRETMKHVLYDITLVGGEPELPSMAPTPGGVIYEAEKAKMHGLSALFGGEGFTGAGYLEDLGIADQRWIEWTVDAAHAGAFYLEIRYALKWGNRYSQQVMVNDRPAGEIVLWTTGGRNSWAWDRIPVNLKKGKNSIRLMKKGPVLIDHLNLLFNEPF